MRSVDEHNLMRENIDQQSASVGKKSAPIGSQLPSTNAEAELEKPECLRWTVHVTNAGG